MAARLVSGYNSLCWTRLMAVAFFGWPRCPLSQLFPFLRASFIRRSQFPFYNIRTAARQFPLLRSYVRSLFACSLPLLPACSLHCYHTFVFDGLSVDPSVRPMGRWVALAMCSACTALQVSRYSLSREGPNILFLAPSRAG